VSNSFLSALVESCNGHYIESSDLSRQEKFGLWMRLLWVLSGVLFVCGLLLVLANTSESMAVGCIWVAVITGGQVMVTSLVVWQVKEGDRAYGYIRNMLTPGGDIGRGKTGVFDLWVMSLEMRASTVSAGFFGGAYAIALLYGMYIDGGLFDVLIRNAEDELPGLSWLLALWLQMLFFVFVVWRFARVWSFFIEMHNRDDRERLEGIYGDLQMVFSAPRVSLAVPYGRVSSASCGVSTAGDVMPVAGYDVPTTAAPGALVIESFSVASSVNVDYSEPAGVRQDGRTPTTD